MPKRLPAQTAQTGPARIVFGCLVLAIAFLTSSCFVLVNGANHGIGMERNRANVVVYKTATNYLYDRGLKEGPAESRRILIGAVPVKLKITTTQRAAICLISIALCLSVDAIGRTLVSWFKSDIRHRGDFWEALTDAATRHHCFAWTFVPSRNLTHKGTGTAGCKTGVLI